MILIKFATEVKGDSTVQKHENWITVSSVQWGVGRAVSASGEGKDRDTSNPSFSEVTIQKSMDVASTELFMQATCGKSLGDCTMHWIQTGGADAKGQHYLEIILKEAIISGYSQSSNGDRPGETISINFNGIQQKYDVFENGKTQSEGEQKGWDLKKNETL